MTVKTLTKPFVAPAGSARRIEAVLNSPPLTTADLARKSNVMSIDEAIRKYGGKK